MCDSQQQPDSAKTANNRNAKAPQQRQMYKHQSSSWGLMDLSTRFRLEDEKAPIVSKYPRGLSASWNFDMSTLFSSRDMGLDAIKDETESTLEDLPPTKSEELSVPSSRT